MTVRLALVDDHQKLLDGLAAILGSEDGYEVVATGGTAADAVAIAEAAKPDAMIIDLSMPGDIFAAMATITQRFPALKLVVFTAFANVELALKALDAGAHAFVLKGRPTNDLFDALTAVMTGSLYASPDFSKRLLEGFRNRSKALSVGADLTVREQQVVDGLLDARTVAEIAQTLELTEKTVRHYIITIMRKIHVTTRLELVRAAQAARAAENSAPRT